MVRRRFGYRSQVRLRRRLGLGVLFLALFFGGGVFLIDAQLRPTITMYSAYQAKVFATRAINDAIYDEFSGDNVRYDNLVNITQNDDGEVTSLQTDMVALNRLRGKATNAVLDRIESMEDQIIQVPMGTLSGIQLLSGRGPMVTLKVVPSGYLQTAIENRFDTAGINQTRHQIMLTFDMSVTAIVPGYSVSTEVITDFCLAETVIVGTVPDAFTNVSGSEGELQRQLFDFRAEAENPPEPEK